MLMISNQIKWLRIWCPLWCFWSTGQKLNNADVGVDVLRESRVDHGESAWIQIIFTSEDTFNVQMVNGDFLSLSGRISIHQSFLRKLCENYWAFFWNLIPEMLMMYVLLWGIHGGFGWTSHIHPSSYVGSLRDGLSSWLQDVSRWDWPFVSYSLFFFKDFEVPMTWNI